MSQTTQLEAFPRIVRADCETEITISATPASGVFTDRAEYAVVIYPQEDLDGEAPEFRLHVIAAEGMLRLRHRCCGEQEHLLRIMRMTDDGETPVGDVRVYSLADDLFRLRPCKGDLHMHSNRSDGQEPPAYVAAACRRIGLDFMALTDHHQYTPSLEARQAFADVDIDLRIFPGEEVHHNPYNPVHIINFGGQWSVNALIADQPTYLAEVNAIEATIADLALRPDRRMHYAQSLWTYQKIRDTGGLSIFCHPYWIEGPRYNVAEALIARHFADQPFDAYEIIGGYFRHEVSSNMLQVARYHEERAQGRELPIVGVSDAHGCERGELFGWYYTIVFTSSTDFPALKQAIIDRHAVAVEALPGESPRIHGPFRLVKYAHFLLREVFPTHDTLCHEEGLLMLAHLAGDAKATDTLAGMRGRAAAYIGRCFSSITVE